MIEDEFAMRLTQLRTQMGVSARDMSLSIGQNPGYINNIETGKALPSTMPFIWSTLIAFSAVSRYQPYSQPFQFHLQFEVCTQLNTFVTSAGYLYQNFLY